MSSTTTKQATKKRESPVTTIPSRIYNSYATMALRAILVETLLEVSYLSATDVGNLTREVEKLVVSYKIPVSKSTYNNIFKELLSEGIVKVMYGPSLIGVSSKATHYYVATESAQAHVDELAAYTGYRNGEMYKALYPQWLKAAKTYFTKKLAHIERDLSDKQSAK